MTDRIIIYSWYGTVPNIGKVELQFAFDEQGEPRILSSKKIDYFPFAPPPGINLLDLSVVEEP